MSIAYRESDVQAVAIEATSYTAQGFNDLLNERNEFKRLLDEEYARRCEAEEKVEALEEKNECLISTYEVRIQKYEVREDYIRRTLRNPAISPAHKLVLIHMSDQANKKRIESKGMFRIDMSEVGQATGLSRWTVGDKVQDLHTWNAIGKTSETVQKVKKGKKIPIEHVSIELHDLATKYPEDIRPLNENGEVVSRNHGGKREHCTRCGSTNLKRVHHTLCLNCGNEHISYTEAPEVQDALWIASPSIDPATTPHIPTNIAQDSSQVDQLQGTEGIPTETDTTPTTETIASLEQDAPPEATEKAMAAILSNYNAVFLPHRTCHCGCRIWRKALGELECCHCEPAPTWPDKYDEALKILYGPITKPPSLEQVAPGIKVLTS